MIVKGDLVRLRDRPRHFAQVLIMVHLLEDIFGNIPACFVLAQHLEFAVLDFGEALCYNLFLMLQKQLLQLELLDSLLLVL